MKAFLFSDLHGSYRALSSIRQYLIQEQIKIVVFAGDAVDMGEPVSFIEELIWVIDELGVDFLWVPGNNDFGRAYHKLNAKYKSLEGKITEIAGKKYTGVGGSPASWSGQYQGEQSVDKTAIAGTIFVSHVPPPGLNKLDKFDQSATAHRNQIKLSDAPLTHICGHVHHTWGVGYLGTTKVIKLASAYLGYAAELDLDSAIVTFKNLFRDL